LELFSGRSDRSWCFFDRSRSNDTFWLWFNRRFDDWFDDGCDWVLCIGHRKTLEK
jgi:hypothetical protein